MNAQFLKNSRHHVLMITNHGIHDFTVRSGLKDTGGQNHYVNALADTLVELGYKVTTFNRGGFSDPVSGAPREGAHYKNENNRIVYLQGGGNKFIRKEDMTREVLDEEAKFALEMIKKETLPVDLIISHYWDGAVIGCAIKEKAALKAKHVFVPHSLGALKRENFRNKPAEVIASLRFDERIAFEKEVIKKVDAVGSTSGDITRVFREFYDRDPEIFLPPCIDTKIIYPLEVSKCKRIYDFLKEQDPVSGTDVKGRPVILEMSRTDQTKRKDVLIRAFHKCLKNTPNALLALTISPDNTALYNELTGIIKELCIREKVIMIGTVPRDIVAELYALTAVYCSPSEMEGFGMSVQEACASRKASVSSDLVPFAVEYLLGNKKEERLDTNNGSCLIRWGDSGAVVQAGNVDGFAHAIDRLLTDEKSRNNMADNAYRTTMPYFTWKNMTERMLNTIK